MVKKKSYQILDRNSPTKFVEVMAEEFGIFGYGIYIVHRDYYYPSMWTVSEPRTGCSFVSKVKTRKEAIAKAYEAALKHTPEYIEKITQEVFDGKWPHLNSSGTRYQKEEYT